MDSISVAPAPAVHLPEAPAARSPSSDEGNGCAKPFEQTLKNEIAQSKPAGADKAETAKAAPADADGATKNTPVDPAEFAALLEGAGLLETEDGLELAEVTDLAADAVVTSDALAAALPTDMTALPVHALPEALALARAALAELEGDAAEGSAEPVIQGVPKRALPDVRALRERDEQPLAIPSAKTETPASEALMSVFASDRASNADMPLNSAGATIDALTSPAFAQRWTPGHASVGDAAAGAPTTTARVDTPFGDSAWGDAFQQKIVWLVDRQQQSAELHVNPAHLGPVDVMLNLGDESAAIAFSSPHQAVREAIEASLSDLRNALGERGLSLGEALVSADSGTAREQMAQEARSSGRGGRGGNGGGSDAVPTEIRPLRISRGLVDLFA